MFVLMARLLAVALQRIVDHSWRVLALLFTEKLLESH